MTGMWGSDDHETPDTGLGDDPVRGIHTFQWQVIKIDFRDNAGSHQYGNRQGNRRQ
jgi:hypothetical protein